MVSLDGRDEAWLRAVWEAASDAIALSNADGIVLAANPAYYELYGLRPDEVIGRSFAAIFVESERAEAEARYRDVFHGPADQPPFRRSARGRDDTERMVESRISFVEEHGHRIAMLSIVRDVTAEVTARQAAAQAEDEQRNFLSSLSHDIKSPLAVIRGNAQVLRRNLLRDGTPPSVDKLVAGFSQIEASAVQVAALLDELVEASGMPARHAGKLNFVPTDFVALVGDVIDRHRRLTDQHELVMEAAVPEVRGLWDATRLDRVLGNLLSNAIKYSPGGGTITVRVGLEANARSQPGTVLTVEDHGIGISTEDLPHVFERFRRGRNVVGTSIDGSGIGLTSVREVVEQHGGTVRISSHEGKGTTVSIWLPLTEGA